MKPFDPTKPVQTRDGRAARIICIDRSWHHGSVSYPIVALVTSAPDSEHLKGYHIDGRCHDTDGPYDLINIPQKRTLWVNMYKTSLTNYYWFGQMGPWLSKEAAIKGRDLENSDIATYLGTFPIEIEEYLVIRRYLCSNPKCAHEWTRDSIYCDWCGWIGKVIALERPFPYHKVFQELRKKFDWFEP